MKTHRIFLLLSTFIAIVFGTTPYCLAQNVSKHNFFHLDDHSRQAFREMISNVFAPENIGRGDSLFSEGVKHSDFGQQAAGLFAAAHGHFGAGQTKTSDSIIGVLNQMLEENEDYYDALAASYSLSIAIKTQLNDLSGAEAVAQQLVALAKLTGDPNTISKAYRELAGIYINRQNPRYAIQAFQKSLDVALPNNLHLEAINSYLKMAFCFNHLEDSAQCAQAIDNAISISRNSQNKKVIMRLRLERLRLYSLKISNKEIIAETDSALASGMMKSIMSNDDYHSILSTYYAAKGNKKLALAHADSMDATNNKLGVLELAYLKFGDWKNAYRMAERGVQYRDSVQSVLQYEAMAEKDAELNNIQLRLEAEKLKTRNKFIVFASLTFIVLLIVGLVIANGIAHRRRLKKANEELESKVAQKTAELRIKNQELEAQKEEITTQNETLAKKNDLINRINKDLTDSIDYASSIQTAILPDIQQFVGNGITDAFTVFIPYKTVSGDFYWAHSCQDAQIFVCADCTGHGVPGAFLSMIGSTILTEISLITPLPPTGTFLEELDSRLKYQLSINANTGIRDGMDCSIVIYYPKTRALQISAARRPVYICQAGETTELKGTKRSIGDRDDVICKAEFTTFATTVEPGDRVYLCSDGFADQFGGISIYGGNGKKLKNSGVKKWIEEVQGIEFNQQGVALKQHIIEWMQGCEQVDDISMIGLQF